jgi:hypothetical protein
MKLEELQVMLTTTVNTALQPVIARIDAIEGNINVESTPAVSKIKRTQKQGKTDSGSAVDTCVIKVEGRYQWVSFPVKPLRKVLDIMAIWKEDCPGGGGYANQYNKKHTNQHCFRCPPEKFDLVKAFAGIGITAKLVR